MLRSQTQHRAIDERIVAVCELAACRDPQDAELLRELLWHWDSRLRRTATEALAGHQQIDDLPTFRGLLEDRDESVRAAAIRAFVVFRQPDDVSLLRRHTDDPELEVRMAAVEAMCSRDERHSLPHWFLASENRVARDVAARLDFELFAPWWWKEVERLKLVVWQGGTWNPERPGAFPVLRAHALGFPGDPQTALAELQLPTAVLPLVFKGAQ